MTVGAADVRVGSTAPRFRLPSAQGPEIALESYRDRRNVIVWFTKGLGCPFCRHLMSQLARIAGRIHGLATEVLQITPTPPDRGRLYARKIALPFPYLCDPQRVAAQAWGLKARGHSARGYLRRPPAPMSRPAWRVTPVPGEYLEIISDEDVGFFIVDRGGDLRYAHSGSIYARGAQLPNNDELLGRLAALNTDA